MKRNIIISAVITIALLVGLWVLRQLSFGELSITTNEQSGIVTLDQSGAKKPKKIGKGDTTIKISPGDYTVEVSFENKVSRSAVTIVKGEQSDVNIQLKELRQQKEVANYSALSLYATDRSISFLNTPQKLLFKYTYADQSANQISDTYPVAKIYHWYGPDEVLFQKTDGTYYYRSNGNDSLISLTGDQNLPEVDALDVNPKGEIAYIHNEKLYYRRSISASSQEIATIKGYVGAPHVSLSNSGVALLSFAPDDSGDNTSLKTETTKAMIVNISSGKKHQLDTLIANSHWSDDGKRFVATTAKGLELYTSSGNQIGLVSSLLESNTNTVTWVDANRFIYADKSTVWIYNTIDRVSNKLVSINNSIARNNPFVINGKSVLYETDPKPEPGSVGTIYSFNL